MLVRGKSCRKVTSTYVSLCVHAYVVYVHMQLDIAWEGMGSSRVKEVSETNRTVREIYLEGGLDKERENDRDS